MIMQTPVNEVDIYSYVEITWGLTEILLLMLSSTLLHKQTIKSRTTQVESKSLDGDVL